MNLRGQTIILIGLLLVSYVKCEEVDDFDEATVEVEPDLVDIDVPYESPTPLDKSKVYFAEHFDDESQFKKQWVKSSAKKEGIAEDIAKYDGEWSVEPSHKDGLVGDKGLVLKSKAKHAAIAAKLKKPFVFDTKPLIVQYEVLLQDGQECGGAYLKLLSDTAEIKNLNNFHDKTPYSIMFGPDKCGNDHKMHLIFKHKNPVNGSVEEKHCKKPQERIDDTFTDKLPHLYTLILQPDNTFEIKLDKKLINSGSLLEDFLPPVNPPPEIDDPNDRKPDDWDEREKIPDPTATKPDDWDEDAPAQIIDESAVMPEGWLESEPTHIPDPDAEKPVDWDSEMDGEWEPPLIDNPACTNAVGCGPWEPPLINNPVYKGKWRAPMIDNPNYKGKWKPKRIQNPDYFEDKHPFKMQPVGAVGFELWSMSRDILFDNIIITDDIVVAESWATDTFDKKRQKIAKDSTTIWNKILKKLNYMPGYWSLYFIYCAIPILFYVCYLWSCLKEESVVQKIANLTNEYPALWAVYILVLGIPVGWVLYLCCKPSSKSSSTNPEEKEELKRAAEKKKTDDVTEDDPESKVDEKESDQDEDKEKYSDKDEDEEDDEDEPVENVEATAAPESDETKSKSQGDAPRKRKARKE